jgi:hypothetical protein
MNRNWKRSSRGRLVTAGLACVGIVLGVACVEAVAASEAGALEPMKYNRDQLVLMAVQGFIAPPGFRDSPYRIDPEGQIHVVPGTGSITYNFRSGDSAVDIAGDHVEPAVTLYNLG